MIQGSEPNPNSRKFKYQGSSKKSPPICELHSPQILPIPIIYRKIQNDKRIRLKLQVSGYKNFSKLSACGEDTPLTLQNLLKAHSMRYIRKFEFDPYLCEKSHMKAFCQALRKFKDLSCLNLVIRRLDYMNESDRLAYILPRLLRLKKLRLELSKIENLDDNGMMRFGKCFGKLYSMRECEQVMVGMDHISQLANMHITKYGSKLKLCQKFTKKLVKATLLTKPDPVLQEVEEKFMRKLKPGRCLKEGHMHFILPQGWLSMSTEVDESAASSLRLLSFQKKLEKFHIGFCGNPVALETIQSLSEGISNLAYLNTLSVEFLNSRVSENEIVLFAQLLLELKALKRLTFKVIQYPNVSEGCICYLLSVLSKLQNIKQFNVYFRRLDTSSEMVQEVLRRSESLNNIQCYVSKHSLAFTRDEQN